MIQAALQTRPDILCASWCVLAKGERPNGLKSKSAQRFGIPNRKELRDLHSLSGPKQVAMDASYSGRSTGVGKS